MRFSINLATRTHFDRRVVDRILYSVVALLIAVLAWNINRAAWSTGELRRLQADIASYEKRLNSRPSGVSEKDFTGMLADIKFFNEIIDRKAYSWLGFLEQVENVTPEGIALSLLSPDRKTGTVKIEGNARSFSNVRAYVEKLEDSKVFTSVLLLSHTEMSIGERTKGVRFSISCRAALL